MATMTLEYPLGRPIVSAVRLRRRRLLPPGAILTVRVGERVRADQPLAMPVEGQRGEPSLAGLGGAVVEAAQGQFVTIEGIATALYGVVGIGGSVVGPLVTLPRGESLAVVPMPRGAIILFPQQAPLMLLQRAVAGGVVGIIAGSAAAREIEAFARTDMTALLDGIALDAPPPPLTLLLTEGFGSALMNRLTYETLSRHLQQAILLTGTTAPRRMQRPEALLTLGADAQPMPNGADFTLAPGARVSVAQGSQRGAQGEVISLFTRQQLTESGLIAPSAAVRLEDGSMRVLPLHALDRVG